MLADNLSKVACETQALGKKFIAGEDAGYAFHCPAEGYYKKSTSFFRMCSLHLLLSLVLSPVSCLLSKYPIL